MGGPTPDGIDGNFPAEKKASGVAAMRGAHHCHSSSEIPPKWERITTTPPPAISQHAAISLPPTRLRAVESGLSCLWERGGQNPAQGEEGPFYRPNPEMGSGERGGGLSREKGELGGRGYKEAVCASSSPSLRSFLPLRGCGRKGGGGGPHE